MALWPWARVEDQLAEFIFLEIRDRVKANASADISLVIQLHLCYMISADISLVIQLHLCYMIIDDESICYAGL